MSLPALVRSTTLPLQVLLSGRVEDSLKPGEPPRGALTIQLVEIDAVTSESRDVSLGKRIQADGTFAFFGLPETAFSRIAEQTYQMRLEVSVPNYQPGRFNFNLGAIPGQPERVNRVISLEGVPVTQVWLFTREGTPSAGDPPMVTTLPLTNVLIQLQRNPVRLQGRVIDLNNPLQGIENATVAVTDGANTTTNHQGDFEFPEPMPLRESLQISVSAPNFDAKTLDRYELDYTQPINSVRISLRPSPP
ncbi:MAG: carboxypeptidase-like regulatory domain-containing protein [Coleofasciculus sp. S288]|nr:carboxypeptidase-like regulatory domain-containing protein [Coleofasciculus sp. S288]